MLVISTTTSIHVSNRYLIGSTSDLIYDVAVFFLGKKLANWFGGGGFIFLLLV